MNTGGQRSGVRGQGSASLSLEGRGQGEGDRCSRLPTSDSSSCCGFTLLELLIAIVLLATMASIVTGAVGLGHRSVERGERRIEQLERFRSSLRILEGQIASFLPVSFKKEGVKQFYLQGKQDSLRFATNYSIWGGPKGFVMVEYTVVTDDDLTKSLYASESLAGADRRRETRLLQGFSDISFDYFSKDTGQEGGSWMGEWNDVKNPPQKVRVRLIWGRNETVLIVPLRAQGAIA